MKASAFLESKYSNKCVARNDPKDWPTISSSGVERRPHDLVLYLKARDWDTQVKRAVWRKQVQNIRFIFACDNVEKTRVDDVGVNFNSVPDLSLKSGT